MDKRERLFKRLLCDLYDPPHSSPAAATRIMSVSRFYLITLPLEILERILLYLPSQDIIKMEAVRILVPTPDGPLTP